MSTEIQEEPQNWYFTFGCGQFHAKRYVKLFGLCGQTRERMNDLFGNGWSMQYPESKYDTAIARWDLQELEVG